MTLYLRAKQVNAQRVTGIQFILQLYKSAAVKPLRGRLRARRNIGAVSGIDEPEPIKEGRRPGIKQDPL